MNANEKTADTMNRNASNIHAALIDLGGGKFRVDYNVGSNYGSTEIMGLEEAAALWEGLQRVGC